MICSIKPKLNFSHSGCLKGSGGAMWHIFCHLHIPMWTHVDFCAPSQIRDHADCTRLQPANSTLYSGEHILVRRKLLFAQKKNWLCTARQTPGRGSGLSFDRHSVLQHGLLGSARSRCLRCVTNKMLVCAELSWRDFVCGMQSSSSI